MARKKRMAIHLRDGVKVLQMGEMEIWDGADLSLLRDTLIDVIDKEKCNSLGVDMRYVKYIPSGFFGMLYDWHEKGASIRLYDPQVHVQNMLWFRQFFEHVTDGCHLLVNGPKQPPKINGAAVRNNGSAWKGDKPTQPGTAPNPEENRVAAT